MRQRITNALAPRSAGVVYALIVLVTVLAIIVAARDRPAYLTPTNMGNILDQSALVGILAVFTTVVLISGNFDLSVASNVALCGCVALKVVDRHGPFLAVVAAVAVGAVFGLINGLLVQLAKINAFIVTLATMTAGRGVVLILTNGRTVTAKSSSLDPLEGHTFTLNLPLVAGAIIAVVGAVLLAVRFAGTRWPGIAVAGLGAVGVLYGLVRGSRWVLTIPVIYLVVTTCLVGFVLRFTVVGRRLYAVGGNADAARLAGIAVNRYRILAFVLNGLIGGFVGVLYASRLGAINPDAISGTELTVLAAAILGGTSLFGGAGSAFKSVVGTLILFVLANGFNILNLGSNYQGLVQGIVILAAAATYTMTARTGHRVAASAAPPSASTGSGDQVVPAVPAATAEVHREITAEVSG